MNSLENKKGLAFEEAQRIQYQKPNLINTKRLFRFDSSNNALKVCKSKLLRNETELKKRGRRSRIDKKLDFLLMDFFYKTKDMRASIKNFSMKSCDFSGIFEDFENCEEFEENCENFDEIPSNSESSYEKRRKIVTGVKRKRGRPRSYETRAKNNKSLDEEQEVLKKKCDKREWKARKTVVFDQEIPATSRKTAEKNAQKTAEKNAQKTAEKNSEKTAEKKVEKKAEKNSQKISKKNSEKLIIADLEKLAFDEEEKAVSDEEICNDFVIELELNSDKEEAPSQVCIAKEKSFQESKKRVVANLENSKKKRINSKVSSLRKSTVRNSARNSAKTQKTPEIVEIEDDDVVEIKGLEGTEVIEDAKNIWLENATENKINFEYDLEEELE